MADEASAESFLSLGDQARLWQLRAEGGQEAAVEALLGKGRKARGEFSF